MPHALELEEIEGLVLAFVRAAQNLLQAGFDGVEVHGGQGHLIQEFLSPFSNIRDDRYGGSTENRMRFALEIVDGIRRACGVGFALGFRLGVEEFTVGGLTFEEGKRIAARLCASSAVDYLSVTQGNFNSIEQHIPDRYHPLMPHVQLAAGIKAVAGGVPIVACGRILDPEHAEDILATGKADLIGLCRPLLADEQWVTKAMAGRSADIRRCISCNQCWAGIVAHGPVACVQNAVCGNELAWGAGTIHVTPTVRRLVIVGGGPAGLEAARVASERGHRVTLFDRGETLGGTVRSVAAIPGHTEIGWVADYLTNAVHAAGVDVRLNVEATIDLVISERPDAVIVATGASRSVDDVELPGELPVYNSYEALEHVGGTALILDDDGYYEPCAIADTMATRGTRVHLATRFFEVGREIPATSRISALRSLDNLGVVLHPTAWLGRVDGREVWLKHYLSGREWSIGTVDCIVRVGRRLPVDHLYGALRGRVAELRRIGDAYMPRRIADAVREGHRAGREMLP